MLTILIRDGAVLTPSGWLQPGFVKIEDGLIIEVGEGNPAPDIAADEVIYANQCAVLPGLVNGHTHFSQTFMRGLGGGLTLLRWLKERIWPLQGKFTPEVMRLAALLGLVENLRCGVTEIVDHHKVYTSQEHTDVVCEAVHQIGVRTTLARGWVDCGENAEGVEHIMADLERTFEKWHNPDGILRIANGPLATWRCSSETLQETQKLARQYGSFTHIHASETRDEVQMCLDDHGMRPFEWLDSIGLLDHDTQLVHAVWVNESDLELIHRSGTTVVLCPVSNAVIGSGIAPIARLNQRAAVTRLGTDGPASNDTQDMWETTKFAFAFCNAVNLDATALTADKTLAMALGGSAKNLDGVGIKTGMAADVIVVDLDHPRIVPVHDISASLVLSVHGSDVDTVIVDGRVLMRDKEVLVLDEPALLEECRQAALELRKQAGLK